MAAALILLVGCRSPNIDQPRVQARADSLQTERVQAYKPGLGEFMLGIQVHHAKLWCAGNARNWKLAAFELDEIKEAIIAIREYNKDRPEIAFLPMISPALDSLDRAVSAKDVSAFKNSFTLLTNTCNNCHVATKHEFNVIKIPDIPPFSNQDFTAQ